MMVEIIPNRHPIFIHFTVALFTAATGLFLLGAFAGKRDWAKTVLKVTHINLWLGELATIATSLLTKTAWKSRGLVYRYGMDVMSMPGNAGGHDDHEHGDGDGHGNQEETEQKPRKGGSS